VPDPEPTDPLDKIRKEAAEFAVSSMIERNEAIRRAEAVRKAKEANELKDD